MARVWGGAHGAAAQRHVCRAMHREPGPAPHVDGAATCRFMSVQFQMYVVVSCSSHNDESRQRREVHVTWQPPMAWMHTS